MMAMVLRGIHLWRNRVRGPCPLHTPSHLCRQLRQLSRCRPVSFGLICAYSRSLLICVRTGL